MGSSSSSTVYCLLLYSVTFPVHGPNWQKRRDAMVTGWTEKVEPEKESTETSENSVTVATTTTTISLAFDTQQIGKAKQHRQRMWRITMKKQPTNQYYLEEETETVIHMKTDKQIGHTYWHYRYADNQAGRQYKQREKQQEARRTGL